MTRDHSHAQQTVTDSPSRFDLLLVAIPLALLSGPVTAPLLSVSFALSVVLGAAVALGLVGYGIYILR